MALMVNEEESILGNQEVKRIAQTLLVQFGWNFPGYVGSSATIQVLRSTVSTLLILEHLSWGLH
jgi:hypothetical protein